MRKNSRHIHHAMGLLHLAPHSALWRVLVLFSLVQTQSPHIFLLRSNKASSPSNTKYAHVANAEKVCQGSTNGQGQCESPENDDNDNDGEYGECEDLSEGCPSWAEEGECVINPQYMTAACRKSCLLCALPPSENEESDPEMRRRRSVFSKMDTGTWQTIPTKQGEKVVEGVRRVLRSMDSYSKEKATSKSLNAVRRLCKNHHEECALWAYQGSCSERPHQMMKECPLACRSCHHLEQFHRCAKKTDSTANEVRFPSNSLYATYQHVTTQPQAKTILSPNQDSGNAGWVVSLNHFLSEQECNHLVRIFNDTLSWKNVTTPLTDKYVFHRHKSQGATCTESCQENPTYRSVVQRLSEATGAPASHVEWGQVAKYEFGQSKGVTHDVRAHDVWKPAGPRIVSLLIILQEPQQGGAVGFPDLDWLLVQPHKGQALIWTNVLQSNEGGKDDIAASEEKEWRKHDDMHYEALPVAKGEKLTLQFWIHSLDWVRAMEDGCV